MLAERHPAIIHQVRDAFPYGPEQHRALDALLKNCTEGTIEPLPSDAPDHDQWAAWGTDLYAGQSWYDVPWLWSESYFYRQLLGAVGYFEPGAWQGIDPFRPFKRAELDAPRDRRGTRRTRRIGGHLTRGTRRLPAARLPLGQPRGPRLPPLGGRSGVGGAGPGATLVADDSERLWTLLSGTGTLCLVADNAGRELIPDLLLLAHLLDQQRVERAVLHIKPHPYYVSDATTADVVDALHRLVGAPGAAATYGRSLWAAMADGRLTVRAHPFSCAPLPYADMPADLRAEFAAATLTIVKGDLNYRRLVGDRRWPPTTPFADATAYFLGPVAALRTLKSDVITGLDARTETALVEAEGAAVAYGGTHALIQVRGA